jgi:hypothetical protein
MVRRGDQVRACGSSLFNKAVSTVAAFGHLVKLKEREEKQPGFFQGTVSIASWRS